LPVNLKNRSSVPPSFDSVNYMRIVEVTEAKKENFTVKTFTFMDKLCGKAEPGQFVMVWIPGVDEIPMRRKRDDSWRRNRIGATDAIN
jgi:dihydroorotate dehydrogenase electron transfer subunit